MSLTLIKVPDELQRNNHDVIKAGVEVGGEILLQMLARRLGRSNLAGLSILDVGCGVRFTQTIINRSIPIGSYTGIEVSLPIVLWLQEHVERADPRFKFVHWDVENPYYNQAGSARTMQSFSKLPVEGMFDVITGFSLFTHLSGADAAQMLRLMRKAVRPDGYLFFSALCPD